MTELIVRYLTDDRDEEKRNELVIYPGGNGDWYVSVVPEGTGTAGKGVRICTSGGASKEAPGLPNAIADAFRAIHSRTSSPKIVHNLKATFDIDENAFFLKWNTSYAGTSRVDDKNSPFIEWLIDIVTGRCVGVVVSIGNGIKESEESHRQWLIDCEKEEKEYNS